MINKLCLLVCEYYRKEIETAVKLEKFDDVTITSYLTKCANPPVSWTEIDEVVSSYSDCSQFHVFGGCCIFSLEVPRSDQEKFYINKLDQCFYMLAGKNIVDMYLKDGGYLVTPGWVENWQNWVKNNGFDRKTAREFFGEFTKQLIFLDTGTNPKSLEYMSDFADFIDLPFEVVEQGLDYLRLLLTKTVLKWRLENEKKISSANSAKAQKQVSDYAMAIDFLNSLIRTETEKEAIQKVSEIFTILFAPEDFFYMTLEQANDEEISRRFSGSPADMESAGKLLAGSDMNYFWTESGKGFLVRVNCRENILGIIKVDELTFPEYKEEYLNLSLTIIGVCGLAISNARILQQVMESKKKLWISNEHQKLIMNSLDAIVYVSDLETNEILFINKYGREIFGDITGKTCWKVLQSDQSGPCDFCTNDMILSPDNDIYKWELRNIINMRWYEAHDQTIQWINGKMVRLSIQVDITERKKIEEEILKAKSAADKANQAKSIFLANMSHELRTPLNAIIGFCQILEIGKSGDLNKKQLEHLGFIKHGGYHLLEMVNDILDLAKIESGKMEMNIKKFNMEQMLSRLPSTITSLLNKKQQEFVIKIDPDIGMFNGDEVRIKQVVYNLLSNAIKFTGDRKSIGLEAKGKGDNVIITVWDQGKGISEQDIERIFQPFEQAEGQGEPGGTGLGLAISKRYIDFHGGTITVESTTGSGSRFSIILPGRLESENKKEIEKFKEEPVVMNNNNDGTTKSIFVIEDNEENMFLLCSIFDDPVYKLTCARSGEEAVKLSSEQEFDLVLMDIRLPGMNGVETMKKLKSSFNEKIPFIAITANAMKGDREKYLEEGFDYYLSKPLDIDELMNYVNTIL